MFNIASYQGGCFNTDLYIIDSYNDSSNKYLSNNALYG